MKKLLRFYLWAIVIVSVQSAFAQNPIQYQIKRADGPVNIDGVLDEEVWSNAQVLSDFIQQFPVDNQKATAQTEIRLTYDDKFLYWSAKMYNSTAEREYVTPSLRRDFRGGSNDMVTITLDTYQDNTNAFNFGINPWGVQREGLISNGGGNGRDLSNSWDNKWFSEAKIHGDHWIAEGAIPFKTLRFKEGGTAWNFNCYRIDTETNERTTLTPIPRNYNLISLAFMSELVWDEPLKKSGPNVSIIPYLAGGLTRDFEDPEETNSQSDFNIGGDAKIAVTPALNLDLTFNPDFSQVEVDQQVTNLQRFELFFPERRQFFLENADLFSNFGHPFFARQFFSRRIGIARDLDGNTVQNKILFGARLSGKIDNNWRIGLLSMQTEREEAINLPSTNYSVAVVQRKIFARSNVGIMFTNKSNFDELIVDDEDNPGETIDLADAYNRVLGIEYNIASADNKWGGKWMYQRSWDNESDPDEFAHSGWVSYRSKTWEWDWAHTWIGENFNAEMGFVRRTGILRINPELGYNFFPSGSIINNINIQGSSEVIWKYNKTSEHHNRKSDHQFRFRTALNFENTSRFNVSVQQRYTFLFDSFDPTNTEGEQLPANSAYTYNIFQLWYNSDRRKTFSYSFGGSAGQYFNGNRYNLNTGITVRIQPYASINIDMNYNKILMPAPYNDADLFLIGPRFDLTMTKKLFLTSFFQFNTQRQNFNINTRLQWRFKPVSDLFIVYTDNYHTENQFGDFEFLKKNRALVLKLTYWLNL